MHQEIYDIFADERLYQLRRWGILNPRGGLTEAPHTIADFAVFMQDYFNEALRQYTARGRCKGGAAHAPQADCLEPILRCTVLRRGVGSSTVHSCRKEAVTGQSPRLHRTLPAANASLPSHDSEMRRQQPRRQRQAGILQSRPNRRRMLQRLRRDGRVFPDRLINARTNQPA